MSDIIFGRLLQVTVCPMLRNHCPVCLSALSVCNVSVLWPNGWMDQDACTWYGGRGPWPRRPCVRWGRSPSRKGRSSTLTFRPMIAHLSSCWALVLTASCNCQEVHCYCSSIGRAHNVLEKSLISVLNIQGLESTCKVLAAVLENSTCFIYLEIHSFIYSTRKQFIVSSTRTSRTLHLLSICCSLAHAPSPLAVLFSSPFFSSLAILN